MENIGNPNLSQYFANDPPSFFDQITEATKIENNLASSSAGSKIASDVKDMWESPPENTGIPPVLTLPSISLLELNDLILNAATVLIDSDEEKKRKLPTDESVTQDERGLRQLIENGCFRSAVALTGRLLMVKGYGSGQRPVIGQPVKHSPNSLQLWFTRLALLLKLGQYETAQVEAEPFGMLQNPDVFFDFYPDMYNGKKGSMASFSFRLLLAEMPIYGNNIKSAMDRLTKILSVCSTIRTFFQREDKTDASEFWLKREKRVLHSIFNCSLMLKDFNLADQLIQKLISEMSHTNSDKRILFSAWGRMLLQSGDIAGSEKKFAECRKLKESQELDYRDCVDKGLIAVAQNNFQEAHNCFEKALSFNKTETMLYNNMAVCLLYSGKLKEAIEVYEESLQKNPKNGLNEFLLINLSTLYELQSNNSKDKKIELLKLLNQYKPDLNISLDVCLKLQTVA